MTFRPMPILSLLAIAGLAVLLWLGSWQLARYQFKQNLPDQIPVSQFVNLTGQATSLPEQYVYTTHNGEALWRVFVPVTGCLTADGAEEVCDRPLFVDVALLSTLRPEDSDFKPGAVNLTDEPFIVVDNLSRTMLSASDAPEKSQWHVANAITMAEAMNRGRSDLALLLEPKLIDIVREKPDGSFDATTIENPFANPARLDDMPPARHLGYALTWFGLAATLIGVYLAFHISTGRLRFRSKTIS